MNTGHEPGHLQPAARSGTPSLRKRVLQPALLVGLALSLVMHVVLLVIAAVWIFGSGTPGRPDRDARGIELAIMTSAQLDALQAESLEFSAPEIPELITEASPDIELSTDLSTDLAGAVTDLEGISESLGSGDVGDQSMGGSGSGAASFFGVEASGSRFAYIADISGSMSVSGKIESLQAELIESVQGLNDNAKFFVCLYSNGPQPLGQKRKWTDATKQGLGWATRLIRDIHAGGGTNPLGAFTESFQLRPRPDAIFFMTDGEFDTNAADMIYAMNAKYEIPIHCITFGSQRASALMQKIARDSGGTYTHIKGPGG